VSFTTKNPLPASTSSIIITFNIFTLSTSAYCRLITSVLANDGRGIMCVTTSPTVITLSNMAAVPTGSTFSLYVKLISTATTSISPSVTIVTYYSGSYQVDTLINQPHINNPISNGGLLTLPSFTFSNPQIIQKKIKKGYFGPIEFYFGLTNAGSTAATVIVLTLTNDYYPYSNTLNLPIICKIGGNRFPCTYSLSPLVVTITSITSISSSNTTLNITTEYL
jgi:hypothetical protein